MYTEERILAAVRLIRLLRRVGVWPASRSVSTDNGSTWQRFIFYILMHTSLTFTYITLMWIEFLRATSLEHAGKMGGPTLTEATLVVKMFNIWLRHNTAKRYMHELASNELFALRGSEERTLWLDAQTRFKKFATLYVGFSLGVVASAHVGVLFLDEYELPFAYWVPFSIDQSLHFWIAYIYECVAMPLTCVMNATMDMMVCYFLFHLSMLYKLIGLRLRSLHKQPPARVLLELKHTIQMHQLVKRLTFDCEALVSAPIMSQVFLSAMILCFIGYSVTHTKISENMGHFIAMMQYVGVMVLEIFLPCYYANNVGVYSSELNTQLYSCDWLQFPIATQRYIFICMEFLKHPTQIRALNFFPIGLPIFTKTINNAYSFFAILLNMEESE